MIYLFLTNNFFRVVLFGKWSKKGSISTQLIGPSIKSSMKKTSLLSNSSIVANSPLIFRTQVVVLHVYLYLYL